MTREEFYTPPKQEIFEDIKSEAIKLWKTYDDTYGYASGKIKRIENITNIKDNTAYIVAMFDQINQQRLLEMVSGETAAYIEELLEFSRGSGG